MTVLALHPSVRGFIGRSITEGPEHGASVGSANAGACATSRIHCQQVFTSGKEFKIPTGWSWEVDPSSPLVCHVCGQAATTTS